MAYLNTASGLMPYGQASPQAQGIPSPAAQPPPQQLPPQTQPQPNLGSAVGGVLGRLIASGMSPGQPGAPLQLSGAVPPPQQPGPPMQLAGGMPQQPQQQPPGVFSAIIRQFANQLAGTPQAPGMAATPPGTVQQQQGGAASGGPRFVNGMNVVG